MKIKCEYCGNYIKDTDENCPHCGGTNSHLARSAAGIPKTIEQLKAFAAEKKLPLEKMRFFIGEDYRGPRAFGIYKDETGNFIVYKNKSDGQRAVRYKGRDEAYAVNELYQKMRTEFTEQKARRASSGKSGTPSGKPPKVIGIILLVLIAFIGIGVFATFSDGTSFDSGYYSYDDNFYYIDSGTSRWYQYDSYDDDWYVVSPIDGFEDAWEDYLVDEDYSENSDYSDVTTGSDWVEYDSSQSSDSSWDDDWDDDDWDTDWSSDWDSSFTDWDSDW